MNGMRAVVAGAMGEPSEVLELRTVPVPRPGPGQVRIRVTTAPVHASDLHTVRGRYGFVPEFPTTPGIESVGVIDEIGSDVNGLTVAQRVITAGVRGTWQEFLVADAAQVLPVPAGMSDSTAAQVLSNPLTAVILTGDELDVQPGEWLLQFPFPTLDPRYVNAVTGSADLVVAMRDDDAVRQFMTYLSTAQAQAIWVKLGGATSVNKAVDLQAYPNLVARASARMLLNAAPFRFGADDLMPFAVERAFWQRIQDFIADQSQLDTILNALEDVAQRSY